MLLFDNLRSVHLFKDVGQIPYQLQRHFGYDTEIVCRQNEERYLYVDDLLKGLKLTFYQGSACRYLLKHAGSIDVLMLFHITTSTIYRGLFYKLLNPKGCLYIKADQTDDVISYAAWGARNMLTQTKRYLLFRQLLRSVDLISFETRSAYRGAQAVPPHKRLLLPNGFDSDFMETCGIQSRSFSDKENLILVVARHGDPVKNTELILDTLEVMGTTYGWQIRFIGPMTDEFIKHRDLVLERNQHLTEYIEFSGQLDDKQELFELYSRAKLLCLTSRRESWGMVCVEAMAFGCVPVMTAVSSAADITADGTCGVVIESDKPDVWGHRLTEIIADDEMLAQQSVAVRDYFHQFFEWKRLVRSLADRLESVTLQGNG